ncbi:hypothetical protein Thi970DRAFT_02414 [Thiorhodovibrio frisius]|uniref:Uncharacterized protein n=1 Tax=Thiorhodovibrio frisius TaxID=631362 RepID=H8YZN7_9GAMM|nr:hypothetical protein Thi970DRAFT_02414 [Thiorhodovibrio frisius]WPL24458.1 hypothetical protein Thiofri_04678 [Thiorhodovibrio frisius]
MKQQPCRPGDVAISLEITASFSGVAGTMSVSLTIKQGFHLPGWT